MKKGNCKDCGKYSYLNYRDLCPDCDANVPVEESTLSMTPAPDFGPDNVSYTGSVDSTPEPNQPSGSESSGGGSSDSWSGSSSD